jgi:hypothetical protein
MDVKNLKEEMEKLKAKIEERDEDDDNESEDGDDANKSEQDGDANESKALGEEDSEAMPKTRARAVEKKPHKTISDHAVHNVKKDTAHVESSTVEKTATKKLRTTGTTTKTVKKPKGVTKGEE